MGNVAAVCLEEKRYFECKIACNYLLSDRFLVPEYFKRKIQQRLKRAENDRKEAESKTYIVGTLPDRGKGLIAAKRIPAGSIVVSEKPLLRLQSETNLERKVEQLDGEEKAEYFSLCDSFPSVEEELHKVGPLRQFADRTKLAQFERKKHLNIYKSNASKIDDESSGLFPVMSRINHSCIPNTNFVWREDLGQQVVIAVREIQEGEEITDSYLPDNLMLTTQERRKRLKETHGFECECIELCSRHSDDKAERDQLDVKLRRIQVIQATLKALWRKKREHKAKMLELAEKLMTEIRDARVEGGNFELLAREVLLFALLLNDEKKRAFQVSRELAERYQLVAGSDQDQSKKFQMFNKNFFSIVDNEKSWKETEESWKFPL